MPHLLPPASYWTPVAWSSVTPPVPPGFQLGVTNASVEVLPLESGLSNSVRLPLVLASVVTWTKPAVLGPALRTAGAGVAPATDGATSNHRNAEHTASKKAV